MKGKRACLVINPHAGQNVTKIADLMAVLSAAGWSPDITIKEYGGHSMELAAKAAKANYDLVIGYGGDGTLNQVLNGVMNTREHSSIVGIIPGGTANVWAAEIGVPHDPVQAALTLINSEARKIDIGHIEVQGLSFPGTARDDQEKRQDKKGKRIHKREVRATSRAKHHFLLMAGLGIDAAIMEHVSKDIKYRVGPLAVGLSAAEEFDDGLLEVCVITAGTILKTIEQIASFLFRRRPDNATAEHFDGASITISVPASIDLQLDGSAVRLKDYLNKSDRKALQSAGNAEQVMVTYRFDAMPRAVQVAIPSTYNGALFEKPVAEGKPHAPLQEQKDKGAAQQNHGLVEEVQHESPELIATLLAHGHQVTVRGVASLPEKQHMYIIAGTVPHQMTGDTTPIAVLVDGSVTILRRSGEQVSPLMIQELREGALIVAAGKKSKYGVIRTTHIMI